MTRSGFGGLPDGTPVDRLVLGAEPGPVLHLLTLGATVHRLQVTGGDGVRRDVVLGLAGPAEMLAGSDYLGATIGRYANRIAHGRLEIDGTAHQLGTHDRGHHLHGGPDGFDRRLWHILEATDERALLGLTSPDGDQGFPGRLDVRASYAVTRDAVEIELTATTDATTLVNLTQHTYFALDGAGAGTIDDQWLTIDAAAWTPLDDTGIPIGDHQPVDGTPFDLRRPRRIGDLVRGPHPQLVAAGGVDHNLVVSGAGFRRLARLDSPRTATRLEVWSDQPGLQVYTGNLLDGSSRGPDGRAHRQGDGVALEPQLFPDSPHHPDWPSALLRPGEGYRHRMAWRFGTLA